MASYIGKPTDLVMHGPLIAVKLWVPQAVKTTLSPIDALAEINTAVAHTYIQEGVATSLGLEPAGTVRITSATTHTYETHLFRIRIAFPDGNRAFEVEAVEIPYMLRQHARIKCTLGRDILRYGVLVYNGAGNMFSLDF